jgi:hypothetical protein
LDDTNILLHCIFLCRLQYEQTSGHIWIHQVVMDVKASELLQIMSYVLHKTLANISMFKLKLKFLI